jgi:hypothetical protein
MSTRSNIIVHRADGKWATVYCHFDGYLDGVGQMLFDHYNSQEKADELVSYGDMSCLYEKCDKPEGHSYDTPVRGYTVYYGRDRGETGTDAVISDNFTDAQKAAHEGYLYVFKDGKWWAECGDTDHKLIELSEALKGD